MALSRKQEKLLRTIAHNRKPVIWVGQHGLTGNVLEEIDRALEHHELIKVKMRVGNRDNRDSLIEDICTVTGAELVQRTGNIVTLYRYNPKNTGINLPRG